MRFKQITVEYAAATTPGVQELKNLVNSAGTLPADSPVRLTVQKLLNTIALKASGQIAEVAGAPVGSRLLLTQQIIEAFLKMSPEEQAKTREAVQAGQSAVDVAKRVVKHPEVSKSFKSLETKIKLDVQGNIIKMDKELEEQAHEIANSLHLDIKWARNLIGMFGVSISREDRNAFIAACREGTALDMPGMFRDKEGKLEDYITQNPPSIKQVFQSVKSTLLDISLSSGQGAATGPFEAMLAIMGGAKKAEKGDLEINGKKYEVKSSSVSVNAKGGTKNSGGWLDSTGELSPSNVRASFRKILETQSPNPINTPDGKTLFAKADFRPTGIVNLAMLLNMVTRPNQVMFSLHAELFPNVAKIETPDYSFKNSIKTIVKSILAENATEVAKQQAIMAMLQYAAGPYQSGFILFNSSFQMFKIIDSIEEIFSLAADPDGQGVHFESKGITMGTGRKSSPGIYYGPIHNSPEGKEYAVRVKQSPEYMRKFKAGLAANKKEKAEHGVKS